MTDNTETTVSREILELRDVSLRRDSVDILRDVSWLFRRGEHWALVGPNGSGKTALVNILTGYLWPTEGTVSVLGELYGTVDIRAMRRRIGVVSSALFERVPASGTCLEVLLSGSFGSLGLFDEIPEQLRERAEEVASAMGLERVLDRRYGVMSFGERQRALIGRAMMAEPELLILDEPCEGLDMAARESFIGKIDRLTKRTECPSVLMVTHRVEELAPGISHALLLSGGRVVAAGERGSCLSSGSLSQAMGVNVEVAHRDGRTFAVVAPA